MYSGLAVETTFLFTAGQLLNKFLLKGKLAFLENPILLLMSGNAGFVLTNDLNGDRGYIGFIYDYYLAERENVVKELQHMPPEASVRWYESEIEKLEYTNRSIETALSDLEELELELEAISKND